MQEKPIITDIFAEHTFSTEELLKMSETLANLMNEADGLENQLANVKKDYNSRIEALRLKCDATAAKIRAKYEMREARAEVRLGDPVPGRKRYYYAEPYPGHEVGEFIREEQMTHSDLQRTLPLEEAPKEESSAAAVEIIGEDGVKRAEVATKMPGTVNQVAPGEYVYTPEGVQDAAPVNSGPLELSIADRLHAAAAGTELPMVQVDLPEGYAPSRYRGLFRKAAKKQGWPEVCINLLDKIAKGAVRGDTIAEDGRRVREVFLTHSEPVPEKQAPETEAEAPAQSE